VFGQDWVMFLAIHCGKLHFSTDFRNSEVPLYLGLLVGQAWTLGVELSFYALAPFIVTRISRIWIALMISIAVRVVLLCVGLGLKDPWTYRFFPAEMMWFMLGALSMRLLLPICEEFLDKNPRWTVFAVVLVLALLVLYPALPCSGAVKSTGLLCLIVVLLPAMFVFQNQSAFDKQIGELSYPMYICHMLVCDLSAAALAKFSVHQIAVVVSVQLGTVIAVAYGINRFIAEPVEKLRKHLRRPALN
jgi:peptidoglycan/LPS O-acetylase OafA/YrhL